MKTDKSHKDLVIEAAKRREYAKAYYQANKDKARAYYRKNRESIKVRAELWRLEHRERYLAQQKEYDKTKRKYPAGEDTHPLDQKPGKNEQSAIGGGYLPNRWSKRLNGP